MRKDYGRHKHTDWRFLFLWLVQTAAATVFFLISLGAFASCGWGILSHLGWIPDPEGVPALQNLVLHMQGHKVYHIYLFLRRAIGFFQNLCTYGYVHSVILLLISFFIFAETLFVLLNRLAAICEIRRYDI